LTAVRDDLQATLADWDGRLARARSNEPAGLLQALATTEFVTPRGRSPLNRLRGGRKRKEKTK
jgi:hypothetical protein